MEIIIRQKCALQAQLDSKKRDFFEYVARELQELSDCGKLDEVLFHFYFIICLFFHSHLHLIFKAYHVLH